MEHLSEEKLVMHSLSNVCGVNANTMCVCEWIGVCMRSICKALCLGKLLVTSLVQVKAQDLRYHDSGVPGEVVVLIDNTLHEGDEGC